MLITPILSGGAGKRESVPYKSPNAVTPRHYYDSYDTPEELLKPDKAALVKKGAQRFHEEEQEFWRQLRRKRDFEGRVAEKRAKLAELRSQRLRSSKNHAEVLVTVDHLTKEVGYVAQQEREIRHDIAVLKESNRALQPTLEDYGDASRSQMKSWSAKEKGICDTAKLRHEQIKHLQAQLEGLNAERESLQERQQVLFERQLNAEQDRNLLLDALQDERSRISDLRAERIKLWDEIRRTQREVVEAAREVQLRVQEPGPGAARVEEALAQAAAPSAPAGAAEGGVRLPSTVDAPLAFEPQPAPEVVTTGPFDFTEEAGRQPPSWTTFGVGTDDVREQGQGASPDVPPPDMLPVWETFGGGDGAIGSPSVVTGATPSFGLPGGARSALAQESMRAQAAQRVRESARAEVLRAEMAERENETFASEMGGITEWAGRLHQFRESKV